MPLSTDALLGALILVVEDEFYVAMDLARMLEDAGAKVLGPVSTLKSAMAVIEAGEPLDGAVLDVNIQGDAIDPVARALQARRIPIVFETGYGAAGAPEGMPDAPVLEKPADPATLLRVLGELLEKARAA